MKISETEMVGFLPLWELRDRIKQAWNQCVSNQNEENFYKLHSLCVTWKRRTKQDFLVKDLDL